MEFIQSVVNRLSQNSFLLKGWSVVLISALFALSATGSKPAFALLAFFPAVIFWALDGYYLWEEKKFRALYDHVRELDEEKIDFSMDTSVVKGQVDPWICVTLSKTLIPFHGVLILSVAFVAYLKFN